jgi:hypothetical protein
MEGKEEDPDPGDKILQSPAPWMTDWEDKHINKSQIKNDYKNRSIKTLISGCYWNLQMKD